MPRPVKYRRIGQMPVYRSFSPDDVTDAETVQMTVDEFETIKLLDGNGLTQCECASRMHIARTTVTAIYDSARKKVADALVNGKQLLIVGGCCEYEPIEIHQQVTSKGNKTMRIAVAYQDGDVFQHFGQTKQFKLYDIEEGKIVNEQIVDTNGVSHGALAGSLKAAEADVVICGGIGEMGRAALAEVNIIPYPGVKGSADDAAKALAEGRLQYDLDAHCDHHHHDHHSGKCGHHHESDHVFGDEECGRRRVEGECARDKGKCGHHHESDHVFGDEECNRRRVEGECARDKGKCGHHHESDHVFGDEECNRRRVEGECARGKGKCDHGHCHKE